MATDKPAPRRRPQRPAAPRTAPPAPVDTDDELDDDSAAVLAAELPAEPPRRRRPVAAVPEPGDDDEDDEDPTERPATLGPVFGKRKRRAVQFKAFGLAITRDSDDTEYIEQYEAHTNIDGGAVLQLMQARTQVAQGAAVMRLMGQTLRNDDGVPAEWTPPAEPAEYDDGTVILDDDPDDPDATGLPMYERWDGELTADVRELIPEHDAGSSRRRFAAVMDSMSLRVELEALTEIAQWLVKETAERPTRRPSPSGTGRRSTGSGSGARRR